MTLFRQSQRLWVTACLVLQVASVSAIAPRDCCEAHRPATSDATPRCHQDATAQHCPHRAADGRPCPMHRAGSSDADPVSQDGCAMRGTCAGPMAALLTLLSNHGVLTASFAVSPDTCASAVPPGRGEHPARLLASPDPPPPRA